MISSMLHLSRILPIGLLACTAMACANMNTPAQQPAPPTASTSMEAPPPPPAPPAPPTSGTTTQTVPATTKQASDRPIFGFNAKGNVDVDMQTSYADDYLARITAPGAKANLAIRVTGGTVSQTTKGTDWTDHAIGKWAALQQKHGFRLIYVVNGNEAPAAQATTIQRWLDAGANFDFIEMMNEYYLPKFEKGETQHGEVTRRVTPEIYVNEILPAFWKELDRFQLPYYVIFAPSREGTGAQDRMENWNRVVAQAVKKTYADRDLNATIHLYARNVAGIGQFDYDQIDRLRALLPHGRHIAVTEAGFLDKEADMNNVGPQIRSYYHNILQHLHAGDYLLDQVLYNPSKGKNPGNLSPHRQGITPKGQAVLQFINNNYQ